MTHTTTPDGPGHRDSGARPGSASEPPRHAASSTPPRRSGAVSLVVGVTLCVLAAALLAGGGWALWKDRVARDDGGFVSVGTEGFRTGQYALVGDLQGDGPDWLYGSSVLGDGRIRAESRSGQPLFIGIGRKAAVQDYLQGAGYATIRGFEVTADTTVAGAAPSGPPTEETIWAASTRGSGRQTLLWTPRSGDWSVVFMNVDATAGVSVRGDLAATLPVLPWLAGILLVLGAAAALGGAWVLARGFRRRSGSDREPPERRTAVT